MGAGQSGLGLEVSYRVEVDSRALKELKRIDTKVRRRLQGAIELLAQDPYPPAAKRLRGSKALRVRIGDYRIIYTVDSDVLLVAVIKLGHRKDIYRN